MARRITVILSQGQSHNPAKRKLEEDIVAALLMERGIEVTLVPNLYDLTPDGTGMLCLQGVSGDMVVLSWLYPRAARWILNRNGVRGHEGSTLLEEDPDDDDEDEVDELDAKIADDKQRVVDQMELPNRSIYCIDLRVRNDAAEFVEEIRRIATETTTQVVELGSWLSGSPKPEQVQQFLHPAPGNVHSEGNGNGAPTAKAAALGEKTEIGRAVV